MAEGFLIRVLLLVFLCDLALIFVIQKHPGARCAFLSLIFPIIGMQCRRVHLRKDKLANASARF